jgi:hypothetical protein
MPIRIRDMELKVEVRLSTLGASYDYLKHIHIYISYIYEFMN